MTVVVETRQAVGDRLALDGAIQSRVHDRRGGLARKDLEEPHLVVPELVTALQPNVDKALRLALKHQGNDHAAEIAGALLARFATPHDPRTQVVQRHGRRRHARVVAAVGWRHVNDLAVDPANRDTIYRALDIMGQH